MSSPQDQANLSKLMRYAFRSDEGEEDFSMQGDGVKLTTTLLEGQDRAILSITSAGYSIASCFVSRGDLLRLKKEFDLLAKVKQGKNPLKIAKTREVKKAMLAAMIEQERTAP